jgi:hypothetical protein
VDEFEGVHHALKAMPDEDPPRRVVIPTAVEPAKPRVFLPLRWLAPIGAAAAVLLMLAVAGPIHLQWSDSQLTISFGKAPASSPNVPSTAVQTIDYPKIVAEVRAQQQVWLAQEIARLENRGLASEGVSKKELDELRGALVSLETWQRQSWREIQRYGGDIQLIAQKSGE